MKYLWLLFKKFLIQIWSVLKGMKITMGHLFFTKPITSKYPMVANHAADLPGRFRGQLALIVERRTNGEPDCISCKMCEKVCPNRSIVIESDPLDRDELDGKTFPRVFDWNYSTCIFCNLCVEACNFDALTFVTTFEGANQSREDLLWDKYKLMDTYRKSRELGHKRNVDEWMDLAKIKEDAAKLHAALEEKKAAANPAVTPGTAENAAKNTVQGTGGKT